MRETISGIWSHTVRLVFTWQLRCMFFRYLSGRNLFPYVWEFPCLHKHVPFGPTHTLGRLCYARCRDLLCLQRSKSLLATPWINGCNGRGFNSGINGGISGKTIAKRLDNSKANVKTQQKRRLSKMKISPMYQVLIDGKEIREAPVEATWTCFARIQFLGKQIFNLITQLPE